VPPPCATLGDISSVLRSKNAGPFELTFDVMFDSPAVYSIVKGSGLLTPALIASLYSIKEEEIVYCGFFDQALAFKATIPRTRGGRRVASGGFMEDDVHGSQNYIPLMNLRLSEDMIAAVKAQAKA
jgi:hypothetical protein